MVGMLVPTWMQERRVSAPELLVRLRLSSTVRHAGRFCAMKLRE
jgi:hypothetical protein